MANNDIQKPAVLGSFEKVSFPEFAKAGKVIAKIDTGAYTGALHCTKLVEENTETGKVLHFSPFDHPEITITCRDFAVRYVRSSNGKSQKRYFIDTNIKVRDKIYPIVLSLANRSGMKWQVLIGRKFLRKNNFLVDVRAKNSVF